MKSLTTIILGMVLFIFVGDVNSQHKEIFQTADTNSWMKRISIGTKEMKLWMSNDLVLGRKAWHKASPPQDACGELIGCEYPVNSCIEHLYGAGPFIGGIVNGVRLVSQA